jgi:hypothetical protein
MFANKVVETALEMKKIAFFLFGLVLPLWCLVSIRQNFAAEQEKFVFNILINIFSMRSQKVEKTKKKKVCVH